MDFGVFVAFDDEFAGGRRMAVVGLLDFEPEASSSIGVCFVFEIAVGVKPPFGRQFEVADFDGDGPFAARGGGDPDRRDREQRAHGHDQR